MADLHQVNNLKIRLYNGATTLLLGLVLLAVIIIALMSNYAWLGARMNAHWWCLDAGVAALARDIPHTLPVVGCSAGDMDIGGALAFGMSVLVVSAMLVGALRWYALRRNLLDMPNQRSSHTLPTPRGGGVVIAGLSLALTIVWLLRSPSNASSGLAPFLGVAAAMSLLGLSDDWMGEIPARWRLVLQALAVITLIVVVAVHAELEIGLPIAHITLSGIFAAVVLLAWGVGFTNAFNFMDGIDGLAGLQACFAFIAWALLLWIEGQVGWALFAYIVAAATGGFLVHNLAPARIFMGDAGSLFLGFSLALLPVMAYASLRNPALFITGGLLIYPFAIDSVYTIFRRWRRGDDLLSAHRSHIYQRLTISGWSHGAVTRLYGVLMVLSVGAAFVYYGGDDSTRLAVAILALILAGACIYGGELLIARQR